MPVVFNCGRALADWPAYVARRAGWTGIAAVLDAGLSVACGKIGGPRMADCACTESGSRAAICR